MLGAKYGGGDGGAASAAKSAFSLQADIQNDDAPHSIVAVLSELHL